jgi:hypothetical protein
LYYSFGGGFTNGASRPEIKAASWALIEESKKYLPQAEPVRLTELPADGKINFYLLTNKGLFLLKAGINDFGALAGLFRKANDVITKINIYSEVKLKHKYFSSK